MARDTQNLMFAQTPYLPNFVSNPHARLRLFCFHFAGGGPSVFRTWQAGLPSEIQVLPVHLPGRERRISEPPFQRWEPLVDAVLTALRPFMDVPFALYGHSMGGMIAFELTRALRRFHQPLPKLLLVSGKPAPFMPRRHPTLHHLPKDQFRRELGKYNGTPQAVLDNAEMMEFFEPILRADFAVAETYVMSPEPPLEVPLVVMGGTQDDHVNDEELNAWKSMGSAGVDIHALEGDHFFIGPQREAVLQIIRDALKPFLS